MLGLRTDVLFFISVYTFASVIAAKPPSPPPTLPKKPPAGTKERYDAIDLNEFDRQTAIYYKNSLQLYFRILDTRLLEGDVFTYYEELDTFNPIETNEITASELTAQIAQLGGRLVDKYHDTIPENISFLQKAIYNRALNWLERQMDSKPEIKASVGNCLLTSKAQYLLTEILKYDTKNKWFAYGDDELKTLKGWKSNNPADEALYFMTQLVESRGQNAANIKMECTDLKTYEDLLSDVNDSLFFGQLHISSYDMIRIVDYAISVKHEKYQIETSPPFAQAIPVDEIDLATMENAMERYKHATLLFVTAFQRKFGLDFISDHTLEDLKNMPTTYSPLRYGSFQWWAGTIVVEMNQMIDSLARVNGLFRFTDKTFLLRLIHWYKVQVIEDPQSKKRKKLEDDLENLKEAAIKLNVFDTFFNSDFGDLLVHSGIENVTTLQDLLNLGQQTDEALSTIMRVTLNQLLYKYKELNVTCLINKKKRVPSDCQRQLNDTKYIIQTFLSIGKTQLRVRSEDSALYDQLLDNMDSTRFEVYSAGITPSHINNEIKLLMEEAGRPSDY